MRIPTCPKCYKTGNWITVDGTSQSHCRKCGTDWHQCDQCPEPAVRGVTDSIEIPSVDPNNWRQFKESDEIRLGCKKHLPIAMTVYLDGRVVPHEQCVPEHVNERLSGTKALMDGVNIPGVRP